MPISVLEANACASAVLATNPGGIPYGIQDQRIGRLVKRGDAESLAKAALEVIGKPPLYGFALTTGHGLGPPRWKQTARLKWSGLRRPQAFS